MANKEILRAELIDILFENRNKAYGAYALRNGYNGRLLTALGVGISAILLFVSATKLSSISGSNDNGFVKNEGIVIREINLPEEKLPAPQKPKEVIRKQPAEKIATVKYVSKIEIKQDAKTEMASVDDFTGKTIGDENIEGKPAVGTVTDPSSSVVGNGNASILPLQPDFTVQERNPEFPGGAEALRKFLARNLISPENLEQGEMKTVRIRFRVDKDGAVKGFEILVSAGDDFDGEVVRVCRKMPRWLPALQNGVNVPVDYVLPVTFVGSE